MREGSNACKVDVAAESCARRGGRRRVCDWVSYLEDWRHKNCARPGRDGGERGEEESGKE